MTDFPREEVQEALDNYLKVREKVEAGELKWEALADCFTDDATYIDPAWGRFVGRDAILQFQRDSMTGLEDWTFPIEWITIDGNRVIIKFWNRLPGQRADGTFYQSPGFQEIIYAGNGKFSYDEDLLNMVHVMELIGESGWIPGPEVKMPEKVVR
ncbi:MAG: nuclear transport factor 2 family protein [Chloroflexi bacterium]|nr:nuclear transport factor 2 family protein [Chloroflexota bacterium]